MTEVEVFRGRQAAIDHQPTRATVVQDRRRQLAVDISGAGDAVPRVYRRNPGAVFLAIEFAETNDLPVLRPTKFEMVVNMKTAKTLGLAVPQSILVASDELIEWTPAAQGWVYDMAKGTPE